MATKATTGSKATRAKICFTGTRTTTGSRAIWAGTWSSETRRRFPTGGTAHKTNDGVRDVIDCGEGTDTVIYTPGVDKVTNCENLDPPEPD